MIRLAVLCGVLAGTAAGSDAVELRRFETTGLEMAIPIRFSFYAPDAVTANRASVAAMAEIRRLNGVFSDYDPASEARQLCARADVGRPVRVSEDLFRVLFAARELSARSEGAFDVTVGPLTHLWRRTLRRGVLPPAKRLEDARSRVGYALLRLDSQEKTVTLLKPGMRLDFGGIAKGYALDRALDVFRRHGINRALLEAGGDIRLGEPPPGRKGWRIGVGQFDGAAPLGFLRLCNMAVSTSGDASQYVEIDGKRYSHVLDPRTGWALTDHSNVTVIAPTGMAADALASAVGVLGPDKGIVLVERLPGVAVLVVRAPGGARRVSMSAGMKRLLRAQTAAPDEAPR